MKATVTVTLKSGVLDPQGKAIEHALANLGHAGISEVRQGKLIRMTVDAADEAAARDAVDKACRDLLANTVIENYDIEIEG